MTYPALWRDRPPFQLLLDSQDSVRQSRQVTDLRCSDVHSYTGLLIDTSDTGGGRWKGERLFGTRCIDGTA